MNHMAEVAKMLGVELEEEFKIPEYYSSYKFKITTNGIAVYIDGHGSLICRMLVLHLKNY